MIKVLCQNKIRLVQSLLFRIIITMNLNNNNTSITMIEGLAGIIKLVITKAGIPFMQ